MKRERGAVALLPVLVLAALITSLLATVFYRHQLAISQDTRQFGFDQGVLAGLSLEQWAADLLERDAAESRADWLREDWALPVQGLPIEVATVSGCIVDMQGRLNLNSLGVLDVDQLADMQSLADSSLAGGYLRLRAQLQLDADPARLARLVDWIDSDTDHVAAGGAEDLDYMRDAPPRRAGNTPFSQLEELTLVAGEDGNALQRLAPLTAALPATTPVNVNTAPMPVLAALLREGDAALAESIVRGRPYLSVEALSAEIARVSGEDPTRLLAPAAISIDSGFFALLATVRIGGSRIEWESQMARGKDGVVRIYARSAHHVPALLDQPDQAGDLPTACSAQLAARGLS
jgi:general secretion pathway protein K